MSTEEELAQQKSNHRCCMSDCIECLDLLKTNLQFPIKGKNYISTWPSICFSMLLYIQIIYMTVMLSKSKQFFEEMEKINNNPEVNTQEQKICSSQLHMMMFFQNQHKYPGKFFTTQLVQVTETQNGTAQSIIPLVPCDKTDIILKLKKNNLKTQRYYNFSSLMCINPKHSLLFQSNENLNKYAYLKIYVRPCNKSKDNCLEQSEIKEYQQKYGRFNFQIIYLQPHINLKNLTDLYYQEVYYNQYKFQLEQFRQDHIQIIKNTIINQQRQFWPFNKKSQPSIYYQMDFQPSQFMSQTKPLSIKHFIDLQINMDIQTIKIHKMTVSVVGRILYISSFLFIMAVFKFIIDGYHESVIKLETALSIVSTSVPKIYKQQQQQQKLNNPQDRNQNLIKQELQKKQQQQQNNNNKKSLKPQQKQSPEKLKQNQSSQKKQIIKKQNQQIKQTKQNTIKLSFLQSFNFGYWIILKFFCKCCSSNKDLLQQFRQLNLYEQFKDQSNCCCCDCCCSCPWNFCLRLKTFKLYIQYGQQRRNIDYLMRQVRNSNQMGIYLMNYLKLLGQNQMYQQLKKVYQKKKLFSLHTNLIMQHKLKSEQQKICVHQQSAARKQNIQRNKKQIDKNQINEFTTDGPPGNSNNQLVSDNNTKLKDAIIVEDL